MSFKKITLFFTKKLVRVISLLVALSLLSFYLVSNSPIDPVRAYVGADISKVSIEQRQKITEYWGLDKPPATRFVCWASSMLNGNFGTSMIFRKPVVNVIKERFLASLALMITAWVLSGILGFLLGIIAGMNQGKLVDRIIEWYCFIIASTPTFWLGLLLLIIFSVWLNWFPIGLGVPVGVISKDVTLATKIHHLILPALTLSIMGVASVALHTRQKLIDVLSSDYVLFARSRGEEGFRLLSRHGIRNIALPAITLQFASFGELFGGSILAEQVFSYPGLGQTTVQAALRGDIPLLLGITIFSSLFVFAGNMIADLLYKLIDPRIREGASI